MGWDLWCGLRWFKSMVTWLLNLMQLGVLTMAMRSIELTVSAPQSLRRIKGARDNTSPDATPAVPQLDFKSAAVEAADLMTNLRGLGWSSSKGLIVPQEKRSNSTILFLLRSFATIIVQVTLSEFVQNILRQVYPVIYSPTGGSMYDPSLPPLLRYVQSALFTIWVGSAGYLAINSIYLFTACVSVLLFRHSPADWPPLFDSPWRATSLAEFWNKRWHQMYRRSFIVLGAKPFLAIFGGGQSLVSRAAAVLGAFLVSGILHDWATWGMGCGTDPRAVLGFFLMNGVGVLLEECWRRSAPGREVRGWVGWVWTTAWLVGWAQMFVDAWLVRGLAGVESFPEDWSVGRDFAQRYFGQGTNV